MADIAARVEFSHSQSIVDIIWSSPLRITSFSRLEDSTTIVPILSGMCPCGSELYPPACEKNAQRASAAAAAISGAVAASPIGRAGQTIINSAISGVEYCVNAAINNNFNFIQFAVNGRCGNCVKLF